MERRRLGSSRLDVSVLALGCWPFAGDNPDLWIVPSRYR
jgi:aryl-alcohol dehydrogenase-like predicted oxidoreductase